jgi:uncharacterized sulfatase
MDMNRRHFLGAIGTMATLARSGHAATGRKPNIVLILADDMGQHQLSCYGNAFYETPNIDRIAAEGMKFVNGYAAAPVCSPTRAGIMTGKYPARLHITDFIPGNPYPHAKLKTPEWQKFLPLEEKVIPEMLAEAGYVSGHFGKWHLSVDKDYRAGRPGDPDTRGFSDVLALDKPESGVAVKAGADPDFDAHHVREITDRAIAFIENNRDKPFFCYVSHSSIHQPVMEYTPRILKYANKPDASNRMGNNPVIGAMVETLDKHTGRLLDTLENLQLADNTLVLFLGDNGDYFGKEGLKPLYGSKGDLYEGGVRVPFLMKWPGVIPEGATCAEPVCAIDFFPTFAEMAGLTVTDPEVDGISLMPAMTRCGDLNRDALYWHYPHYHSLGIAPSGAVRQGNYKLIECFEQSIEGIETSGALELFDLEQDPGERHNLAAELPEKTHELYEKLKAWRINVDAQEMELNPNYDPEHAERRQ